MSLVPSYMNRGMAIRLAAMMIAFGLLFFCILSAKYTGGLSAEPTIGFWIWLVTTPVLAFALTLGLFFSSLEGDIISPKNKFALNWPAVASTLWILCWVYLYTAPAGNSTFLLSAAALVFACITVSYVPRLALDLGARPFFAILIAAFVGSFGIWNHLGVVMAPIFNLIR